jgi:hypothetical protein
MPTGLSNKAAWRSALTGDNTSLPAELLTFAKLARRCDPRIRDRTARHARHALGGDRRRRRDHRQAAQQRWGHQTDIKGPQIVEYSDEAS